MEKLPFFHRKSPWKQPLLWIIQRLFHKLWKTVWKKYVLHRTKPDFLWIIPKLQNYPRNVKVFQKPIRGKSVDNPWILSWDFRPARNCSTGSCGGIGTVFHRITAENSPQRQDLRRKCTALPPFDGKIRIFAQKAGVFQNLSMKNPPFCHMKPQPAF